MRLSVVLSGVTHNASGDSLPDILAILGTNRESVIVLREGKVVLEEDVADGDTITLLPVASGG